MPLYELFCLIFNLCDILYDKRYHTSADFVPNITSIFYPALPAFFRVLPMILGAFDSGAREQGVLRVLQHPLFFSVGNCKLLWIKKTIGYIYIYIIYCISILEYLGFDYEKRFDYVWVLSYSNIQIKSRCVLLTNQICCCRLQCVTKVTLRDVISVRHKAHEHVAKENLWVFQKP